MLQRKRGAVSKIVDVRIEGQMGLYTVEPLTWAGHAWRWRHLAKGERTSLHGRIICEGGPQCREIVANMVVFRLFEVTHG